MSDISLRDYFAGLAMQGLMLGCNKMDDMYESDVVDYTTSQAYFIADMMIAERNKHHKERHEELSNGTDSREV